ncbi:hypothetical protein MNV49_002593 [Pseudohyphozyma bogoriensis]|nr:hypothetical protein MNV49_002593 [Pseudohyphozyma bogoriensis]
MAHNSHRSLFLSCRSVLLLLCWTNAADPIGGGQTLREGLSSYLTRITGLEQALTKALANGTPNPLIKSELPDHPFSSPSPSLSHHEPRGSRGTPNGDNQHLSSVHPPYTGVEGAAGGAASAEENAEIEASVALEFMALGRPRPFTGPVPPISRNDQSADGQPNPQSGAANVPSPSLALPTPSTSNKASQPHPHQLLPSPITEYPSPSSWALAAPAIPTARILISHSVDSLGWLICGVVHGPTFQKDVTAFWSGGEESFETSSPAWIALYFALLCCGVSQITVEKRQKLGMREDDLKRLYSLQAISILGLGARDAWSATAIATLITTGLSIAQDLGLHQMVSDETWDISTSALPAAERNASLITREINKRVFWALVREDFFAIPFRRSYALRPSQISTPLPLNISDWDLCNGFTTNASQETFTVVSFLLQKIKLASYIQAVYENKDNSAASSESFEFVRQITVEMEEWFEKLPTWLQPDGPMEGMPPYVDWMRSVFYISSRHKLISLNRPFFHRALTNPIFAPLRARSIEAARLILREAAKVGECRVWTVLYHISAAAFVLNLGLFQTGHPSDPESQHQRLEVEAALSVLRNSQDRSDIASRGVELIAKLIADESAAREAVENASSSSSSSHRHSDERSTKRQKNENNGWWDVPADDPGTTGLVVGDDQALSSLFLLPRKSDDVANGWGLPVDLTVDLPDDYNFSFGLEEYLGQ